MTSEILFDIVKYVEEQTCNGLEVEACIVDRGLEGLYKLYLTTKDEFHKEYTLPYNELLRIGDIRKVIDDVIKDFRTEHMKTLSKTH